ncbi:hypothetical protein QUF58_13115 [Anaerolineales bacterium HSG24]|nr:hypothetical protein [Anaerolineales bacterium HSG24]
MNQQTKQVEHDWLRLRRFVTAWLAVQSVIMVTRHRPKWAWSAGRESVGGVGCADKHHGSTR